MNEYALYTPAGHIDRTYSGTDQEALLQPEGDEQVVLMPEGLNDVTAYVHNGEVVAKAPFSFQISSHQIVADGVDTVTITNVPVGTLVRWHDGQEDTINDGTVEFDTDLPGTYTLRFSAIPYLDQEVTLEAVSTT